MRRLVLAVVLAALATSGAVAQSSPDPRASSKKPVKAPAPAVEPSAGYSVMVTPDKSATAMADPGTVGEFGSPSATESPSMPMPMVPPPIDRSAKRPPWVKKAPPEPGNPTPPPR